jgi:predicted alpha/beta superfamily hydrolase
MATDTIVVPVTQPGDGIGTAEVQETTDLRRHTLSNKLLGGKREIIVYIPAGYDLEPERRYPVLYMQDGQNLFDPATSFVPGKPWRMDQTAEVCIREGRVEPVIIVGIYNAGEKRIKEYTPVKDAKRQGGQADKYLRAITEVIKPFIDLNYRTLPGAHNTGIGGSSLGGLFTLYAGLECPEVFGKLSAMSPSAWWAKRAIIKMYEEAVLKPRLSIWLDIGTREGLDTLEDARRLRDVLKARGWIEGNDLKYFEAHDAAHEETAWAERVAPMLEFLFPA